MESGERQLLGRDLRHRVQIQGDMAGDGSGVTLLDVDAGLLRGGRQRPSYERGVKVSTTSNSRERISLCVHDALGAGRPKFAPTREVNPS